MRTKTNPAILKQLTKIDSQEDSYDCNRFSQIHVIFMTIFFPQSLYMQSAVTLIQEAEAGSVVS